MPASEVSIIIIDTVAEITLVKKTPTIFANWRKIKFFKPTRIFSFFQTPQK